MALVAAGFKVCIELCDIENDRTTRCYEMTSADETAALADAATVVAALDALTDDTIVGYQVSSIFANDAFALPIVANTQNFNQALLIYGLDGLPGKEATQSIPAPSQGIFVAASGPNAKIIDTADAAVIAWRTLFQAPGNLLTLSDGETADTLLRGHRRSVKSTQGN